MDEYAELSCKFTRTSPINTTPNFTKLVHCFEVRGLARLIIFYKEVRFFFKTFFSYMPSCAGISATLFFYPGHIILSIVKNMEKEIAVATFNVGGQIHQVSRSLLDQHPKTMVARIASSQWLAEPDSDIFIDRDGDLFRYVLNYLRDGEVCVPMTVPKNALINELHYFGIDITAGSVQVYQQATAHGAMAVNKYIESLEKDELCIRFARLCITAYKCNGNDVQFQFFVRFDSTDEGKSQYQAAEIISEGGEDMLERCNKYLEAFGLQLKSVAVIEVLRHRPKYSVLVEVPAEVEND